MCYVCHPLCNHFFLLIAAVMEEGLHKLWQGVTPAIYRHIGKSIFIFVSKMPALLCYIVLHSGFMHAVTFDSFVFKFLLAAVFTGKIEVVNNFHR